MGFRSWMPTETSREFREALCARCSRWGRNSLVLMGFLLVVFDRRRQALHDKLAHTYVICQG